jgi:hypothetical protein
VSCGGTDLAFRPHLKEAYPTSTTKLNWLMLSKEIIAVYSENQTKPINTFSGRNAKLLIIKESGRYNYQ